MLIINIIYEIGTHKIMLDSFHYKYSTNIIRDVNSASLMRPHEGTTTTYVPVASSSTPQAGEPSTLVDSGNPPHVHSMWDSDLSRLPAGFTSSSESLLGHTAGV